MNLAIADILFAVFIAPSVLLRLTLNHPEGITGTVLCKLLTGGNVAWVGGIASVITLVTIAIERYYAVMYPLGNKWKFTTRKLKVSLICNLFKFSKSSFYKTVQIILVFDWLRLH